MQTPIKFKISSIAVEDASHVQFQPKVNNSERNQPYEKWNINVLTSLIWLFFFRILLHREILKF